MLHVRVNALEVHRIQADRKHHHLHHAERRDQQALQSVALLLDLRPCRTFRRQRLRLIPEFCELCETSGQPGVPRMKLQAQPVGDRIDVRRTHTRLLAHRRFDQPAARGAVHPAHVDCHRAQVFVPLGKCVQHIFAVEDAPFGNLLGRPPGAGVRRIPQFVVATHSGIPDELGHGFAPGTAHGLVYVVEFDRERAAGRDRQGAVKAGIRARHCRWEAMSGFAGLAIPRSAANSRRS